MVCQKKLKFIPNPVFIDPRIKVNNLKSKNLEKGEFILAAGRLEYQKGFDILIKSFQK